MLSDVSKRLCFSYGSVNIICRKKIVWLKRKMKLQLKRIFDDGELVEDSVIKKYLITATDDKRYNTTHIDAFIGRMGR